MIDVYSIIALVAGITASVILAEVLFTVAWIHRNDKTRYSMLLRIYAFSTLLDSGLMVCLLYVGWNCTEYRFLQCFVQPTLVSIETGLGAFAIFRFLRGSSHYLRQVQLSFYGFCGAVLLYPVLYGMELDSRQEFWNISNYLEYARSIEGIIISIVIYVMAFTFNFLVTKNIFQGYLRYREILQKYFSFDLIHIRHVCMVWWGLCLSYVFLAYINIFVGAPATHHVLRYFMIVIFTGMVLILISNADMLNRVDEAFRSIKIYNIELLSDTDDANCKVQEMALDVIEVRAILEHWAKRNDKPFNEIGLTLKAASDDMHLPMSVVLKYVNICYGMSFRNWILALRDEAEKEEQREYKGYPGGRLSEKQL